MSGERSVATENKVGIPALIISVGKFSHISWKEHQAKIQEQIHSVNSEIKEKDKQIVARIFNPSISCKSKLKEKFEIVVLHCCDHHLTKKYYRDINKEKNGVKFFSLNQAGNYIVDGVIRINNLQEISLSLN